MKRIGAAWRQSFFIAPLVMVWYFNKSFRKMHKPRPVFTIDDPASGFGIDQASWCN